MLKKNLSLCIILSLIATIVFGQKKYLKPINSPFSAGILAGASLSQVNGDESQGFNKIGAYGGLRGVIRFSHKFNVLIEILYSQKGSKLGRKVSYQPDIQEFIKVNYMEIPVLGKIFLTPKSEGPYVSGGLSYARQINSKIEQHIIDPERFVNYAEAVPQFNKNDLFAVVGCGIDFKEHYGIGYRFSFSLLPFYHDKNYTPSNIQTLVPDPIFQLRNYMMTMYGVYRF